MSQVGFSTHPHLFFSLISACFSLFLLFLALQNYKSRASRTFALLILSTGLWQLGKLLKNLTLAFPVDVNHWFWSHTSFIGATMIYPIFFRLALRIGFRDRGFWNVLNLVALFSAFIFIGLEISGLLAQGERITQYGFFRIPTFWYHIYVLTYLGFMFLGFILLFPRSGRNIPHLRGQGKAIFLASVIGFSIGSLEFWNIYNPIIYPVSDFSPWVFCGILYWAIFRYNMLHGRKLVVAIGARILYLLFLLVATWSVYLLAVKILEWLEIPPGIEIIVMLCAITIFVLTPAVLSVWNWILKKLSPVRYSYRKLFTDMAQRFIEMGEPEKMYKTLLQKMSEMFGYDKGTAIIFSFENGKYNQERFILMGAPIPEKGVERLIKRLQKIRIASRWEILVGLRLGRYNEKQIHHCLSELRLLQRLERDLIIPVATRNHLAGILLFRTQDRQTEDWNEVSKLLFSLAEILANHTTQVNLITNRSREEHLSKVGMLSATVAHEIKNPLEGIYGAAQILKEENKGNPRFIDMVLQNATRLNDLVHQFLQFARPYQPKLSEVDLIRYLDEFCRDQNALGKSHHIKLKSKTSRTVAITDPKGLNQVLLNLVQNARRYQPDEMPIEMTISQQDGKRLKIHIRDLGKGVEEKHRNMLFEPFFTTSNRGTGLGLATSRKIAREMGGDLYFQPAKPGSEFIVEIPKSGATTTSD